MANANDAHAVVVDDDLLVLLHASDILADAGFTTLEASNRNEAKTIIENQGNTIVLLFTDLQMPGLIDGFALAHHVAKHWPEIEIVVASGHKKPQAQDIPKRATFMPSRSARISFLGRQTVVSLGPPKTGATRGATVGSQIVAIVGGQ